MSRIKLGEICQIVSGSTPKTSIDEYWDGDKDWITPAELMDDSYIVNESVRKITELGVKKTGLKPFPRGTVILSSRAPIGKVAIAGKEMYCNQGFKNLICSDAILPEYLYWFLKGNAEYLNSLGRGATFKEISKKIVSDIEINVPDIGEQKNAVDFLERCWTIIRERRNELDKLDELVKARFVEMMNDNPSANLLSEFINPYKAQRCGDRELPVLSITKADGIVFQDEKFKKRIASKDTSSYKVIPRGKLVQGIHIDERNFAIQNITDEGIVSPAYKVWTVNERSAIPEVLAYALRSDYAMAYINSKFAGSVKRRESISIDDFLAMPINLPSLDVQKVVYEFMQQVDKSKVAVQKSLDETRLLFDSLMQEYFG